MNRKLIRNHGAKALMLPLAIWALCLSAFAAPNPPSRAAGKSILSGITVSAVGAYHQAEFTRGPSQWGAGIDAGLPVNRFVSIHVRNLAFEAEDWRGSVVDETALYGRADFVKFAGEIFRLYGTGGGTRHWEIDDWSFGVGLGAEYRFNRNVSLSAGREIRAYFGDHRRDWLTTAQITFRF